MKKQKKLNLGKIKIAGISNLNTIVGGIATVANGCQTEAHQQTCRNCHTSEPTCVTVNCDTHAETCGTTQHTKAESNYCGAPQSQRGAIC